MEAPTVENGMARKQPMTYNIQKKELISMCLFSICLGLFGCILKFKTFYYRWGLFGGV